MSEKWRDRVLIGIYMAIWIIAIGTLIFLGGNYK